MVCQYSLFLAQTYLENKQILYRNEHSLLLMGRIAFYSSILLQKGAGLPDNAL